MSTEQTSEYVMRASILYLARGTGATLALLLSISFCQPTQKLVAGSIRHYHGFSKQDTLAL